MPSDAIVYDLGHIEIVKAVLDSEGEVITNPILSEGYCVDIMCEALPEALTPYIVWPSDVGNHIPSGWEDIYKSDRDAIQ